MPRHYTRVIKRAPKKKWCGHFEDVNISATNFNASQVWGASVAMQAKLAVCSSDTSVLTPPIVKCGRFNVNFYCILNLSDATDKAPINFKLTAYLIYVPEGWPITETTDAQGHVSKYTSYSQLIPKHPEWILARRQITAFTYTSGAAEGVYDSKEVVLTSGKLKRNLNSGDNIRFVIITEKIAGAQTIPFTVSCVGTATYWTAVN